jgi:hypothetical protein
MSDCVDTDHFQEIDGVIAPQPWMQWRNVGSIEAPTRTAALGATITDDAAGAGIFGTLGDVFGGLFNSLTTLFGVGSALEGLGIGASAAGNKNVLIHSLQRSWQNNTPIPQWCYGMVTRGGCRVTLQARSRGGLVVRTGSRTAWVAHTDFASGGSGHWPLNPPRVQLAEVADIWTLRLAGDPAGLIDSVTAPVTVSPGDRLRVRFRARRDAAYDGDGPNNAFTVNTDSWTWLAGVGLGTTELPDANVWYPQAIDYTVPATGVAELKFQIVTAATAGNLYIGDVDIDIIRGKGTEDEIPLTDASMFGVGGDIGRGGVIAQGTDFCNMSQQMPSATFPLQPEVTGWTLLAPGEVFTARAEVRFISEFWETSQIDGGNAGLDSSFESGATRLDLFAVPYIPDPRHVP